MGVEEKNKTKKFLLDLASQLDIEIEKFFDLGHRNAWKKMKIMCPNSCIETNHCEDCRNESEKGFGKCLYENCPLISEKDK